MTTTADRAPAAPPRRPLLPPLRSMAAALAVLVLLLGAGMVFWALPLQRPLGRPGTFTDTPVTATDLQRQRVSNSPMLAADPTEPRFLALAHRTDGPDLGCGLQVSGDGGDTWIGADPVPVPPAGADRCYSPEVAFDARGALHYLFVGLAGAVSRPVGAFLTTSTDRGRTFSPPRQVLGPLSFGVRMAVDQGFGAAGRIHLAWLRAGAEPVGTGFAPAPNQVMAAHSDDGGTTFSQPVVVSNPARGRVAAPTLALAPEGRVEVAYYDLGDDVRDFEGQPGPVWAGRWSVLSTSSTDRGHRYGQPVLVDDGVVPAWRVASILTLPPPALAAGRARTCAAWTDARHGDPDVLLRCAGKDGRWTPPLRVNDDPVGSGRWQYLPQIAFASTGRMDMAFYDRRSDQRNDLTSVSFSYTYDGRRLSGNVPVNRFEFSGAIGPAAAAGPADFGSRIALVSLGSSALAAWTDTRNQRPGAVAQDVYSARATLLFAADRPGWAMPAGLGLAAASGGALAVLRHRRPEDG